MAIFPSFIRGAGTFIRERCTMEELIAATRRWGLPIAGLYLGHKQLTTQDKTLDKVSIHADLLKLINQNIEEQVIVKYKVRGENAIGGDITVEKGIGSPPRVNKFPETLSKRIMDLESKVSTIEEVPKAGSTSKWPMSWLRFLKKQEKAVDEAGVHPKVDSAPIMDKNLLVSLLDGIRCDLGALSVQSSDEEKAQMQVELEKLFQKVDNAEYHNVEQLKKDVLVLIANAIVRNKDWEVPKIEEMLTKFFSDFNELNGQSK